MTWKYTVVDEGDHDRLVRSGDVSALWGAIKDLEDAAGVYERCRINYGDGDKRTLAALISWKSSENAVKHMLGWNDED